MKLSRSIITDLLKMPQGTVGSGRVLPCTNPMSPRIFLPPSLSQRASAIQSLSIKARI